MSMPVQRDGVLSTLAANERQPFNGLVTPATPRLQVSTLVPLREILETVGAFR